MMVSKGDYWLLVYTLVIMAKRKYSPLSSLVYFRFQVVVITQAGVIKGHFNATT